MGDTSGRLFKVVHFSGALEVPELSSLGAAMNALYNCLSRVPLINVNRVIGRVTCVTEAEAARMSRSSV